MPKRFITSLCLALGVVVYGTLGYYLLEDWTFLESLYMTAITVTTVGFSEVRPLSWPGRIFTMTVMGVGIGTIFYILSILAQALVEGQIRQVMGRRSLQRHIKALKGHYIVCGYGRIGAMVAQMLKENGLDLVVVDNDEKMTQKLEREGILYILGSATEDEVLTEAGIERAQGLVASVSSDSDNVYIVLSARGMRPDMFIIARSSESGGETKLKRAGANKVVSPYFIGARRIAQMVIRPSVADFIDLTYHSTDINLQMEELMVGPDSDWSGQSLKDSGIRQKLDIIVLAVKKPGGEMIFNPPADLVMRTGDTLIALGPRTSMQKLGNMLGHRDRMAQERSTPK